MNPIHDLKIAESNFDLLQNTPPEKLNTLKVGKDGLLYKQNQLMCWRRDKKQNELAVKTAIDITFNRLGKLDLLREEPGLNSKDQQHLSRLWKRVIASEQSPTDGFQQALDWAGCQRPHRLPGAAVDANSSEAKPESPPASTRSKIKELPPELLAELTIHLGAKEKVDLTRTSKSIRQTVSEAPVWKELCALERPVPWNPDQRVPDPFAPLIEGLPVHKQEAAWHKLNTLRSQGKEPLTPTPYTVNGGWLALRGEDRVTALRAMPDGRFVTGSRNGTMRLWSAEGELSKTSTTRLSDQVNFIKIFPDGSFSAQIDLYPVAGHFSIWSPDGDLRYQTSNQQGNFTVEIQEADGTVRAICGIPHDHIFDFILLSSGNFAIQAHRVEIWGPDGNFIARAPEEISRGKLMALPGGRIASVANGRMHFWNPADNTVVTFETELSSIFCLEMIPLTDGTIALRCPNETHIWNPKTGRTQAVLSGHTTDVNTTLDGNIVTTYEGRRTLWQPNIVPLIQPTSRPTLEEGISSS